MKSNSKLFGFTPSEAPAEGGPVACGALLLTGFIFILSLCLFFPKVYAAGEAPLLLEEQEKTISMDFQDARLKDILKIFSIQSGLNFVASEEVQDRTITLYFDKILHLKFDIKFFL